MKGDTGLTRAHNVQGIHKCLSRCQGHHILCSLVFPFFFFGGGIIKYNVKFIISTIFFCTPVIDISNNPELSNLEHQCPHNITPIFKLFQTVISAPTIHYIENNELTSFSCFFKFLLLTKYILNIFPCLSLKIFLFFWHKKP